MESHYLTSWMDTKQKRRNTLLDATHFFTRIKKGEESRTVSENWKIILSKITLKMGGFYINKRDLKKRNILKT